MRSPGPLAIALIVLRLSAILADYDAPSPSGDSDDDDLDLEPEEDFEDGGRDPMGGMPPVEDFDLELSEDDKTTRMGTCFSYTIGRMQARRDMMMETAKQIMEQHGVHDQQAVTAVLSNWMMACYMNIESAEIDEASGTKFGAPIEVAANREEEMFGMSPSAKQTAPQASQRQWSLLQTILKEHSRNVPQNDPSPQQQQQQQQRQESGDTQSPRGQPQLLGSGMDTGTGFLYMTLVFTVLFGVGTIVVLKLNSLKPEVKGEKDRGSKSEKKKEKAEKQAAKKRM